MIICWFGWYFPSRAETLLQHLFLVEVSLLPTTQPLTMMGQDLAEIDPDFRFLQLPRAKMMEIQSKESLFD